MSQPVPQSPEPLFVRSRMYNHKQMEDCLKPMNLENITPQERFTTEQARHYRSLKSQLVNRVPPVTRDGCTSPFVARKVQSSHTQDVPAKSVDVTAENDKNAVLQKYINDFHNQSELH
jgi:hypothetical protein